MSVWRQGCPQIQQQMETFELPFVITAASDFVSEIFIRRFGRIPTVVPNGVDTKRYPNAHTNENLIPLVKRPALGRASMLR
jgi:hypothetical protein